MLRFRTFGRASHAVIDGPDALALVPELDQALWVSTAAPVGALKADPALLTALDGDKDSRIRADDLCAAIKRLLATVADRSSIRDGNETLALAALSPEARPLADTARLVLALQGVQSDQITLEQVRKARKEEEARGLSQAGKVLPGAQEGDLRAFLEHVVEVTGGEAHASGAAAVTEATLTKFLGEASAWLAWHDQGVPGDAPTAILPLGAATGAAADLAASLADKLDQYFLLCDAVRLDAALAARCWPDAAGTDLLDSAAADALLRRAPLARPRADGILDLDGALNPAFADALQRLRAEVITPLLGAVSFDRAAWREIRARFAPWHAWVGAKPATKVGARPVDEIRRHAGDESLPKRTRALLAESEAAAKTLALIQDLEQIIALQAGILRFTNSFVAQPDLYGTTRRAMYEWGDLVLDGRRFTLAVKVPEAARHEKFAAMGATFVLYVMVGEKNGAWDYEVAVPVTAGERGTLVEGMWGIFTDLDGKERHAQIRKIVTNPISLKEAIFAPIWRIGAAVAGLVDKAGAAQEAALSEKAVTKAQTGVDAAVAAPTTVASAADAATAAPPPVPAAAPAPAAPAAPPAAAPAAPGGLGNLAGLLAAGGLALAAVGSTLAYIGSLFWTTAGSLAVWFTELPVFATLPASAHTAVAVVAFPVAVLLVLAGFLAVPLLTYLIPVTLSAWLKLRRRDLSSLLEGSGFAMNTRMYVTRELAARLTQRPAAPAAGR